MFAFDDKLETNYETVFNRHTWMTDILLNYGDVDYANIFSSSLYAAGLLSGNDELRITGRLLLESLFIGGSTALLLRVVTGRPRPFTGESASFKWFKTGWEYQSFPSGHMTVVFAVSTVLAERINNNWVRGGFYGLSAVAMIERIYSSEHWFSDAIIGSLLGYGSAVFVLNRENQKDKVKKENGVSFFPSLNGINLIWKF
jgi:membrane-associated phospholipid phosphatase